MLILTRTVGQRIMIEEDITVAVLSVKGKQVKLGVTAPKETPVHREEVYERMRQISGRRDHD